MPMPEKPDPGLTLDSPSPEQCSFDSLARDVAQLSPLAKSATFLMDNNNYVKGENISAHSSMRNRCLM